MVPMRIHRNTDSFTIINPVVTIGIFDGVHLGHRHILQKIKEGAESINGESVVITLWPHPRLVLNNNPQVLRYLSSIEEKALLLEQAGLDHLIIIEFTKEFAQLTSCEFIKDILVDRVGIKHLVIGYNHKFGKNREGDFQNLKSCADQYNFSIERAEAVSNHGLKISSSLIRENLLSGNLEDANRSLGYDYFLQGKVTGGNRMGREIGFPTANIMPRDEHKLIPCDGVYAVRVEVDNFLHGGMLNIGYRPTLNSPEPVKTIEVNIFNFDGDIYTKDITLFFKKRLREEKKFENIEQLREQLVKDKEMAVKELNMGVL
jgi:riboflavin kinase / FMN adenylyltransferase